MPSQSLTLATAGAEDTRDVARALAGVLRPGDMLVLDGALGAGKTTFTQGLGEALGVRGPVASPTFVIARVHPSLVGGSELVHVDAYRLQGGFEIDDLDLDADMDRAVTVVEWGRDRVEHLADSHLLVQLDRSVSEAPGETDSLDEERSITLAGHGPRWAGQAWDELVNAVRSVA
ncbi:tRNA (adenosine(37)-N6)-threonylcarbamoyltransferase complex ATPase subunit type 1 TsaE [Dermabacteraceae bacterium P7006]